jgi:hypothetical protein
LRFKFVSIDAIANILHYSRERDGQTSYCQVPFLEQQFKQREYLAQLLEDLERILKLQSEKIYDSIIKYSRTDSEWLIDRPLTYTVKLIQFKPNFNQAEGYIPTPKWLNNRKAVINIKSKDDQCFIKCIYRALNYDVKHKNNFRDISNKKLQEFIKQHNIDLSMFTQGYVIQGTWVWGCP